MGNLLQEVSVNKINKRLTTEIFEGCIQEAFLLFVLVQSLGDGISS